MIKVCKSCGKEFQNLTEGVLYSSNAIGVLEFCSDACSKNYLTQLWNEKFAEEHYIMVLYVTRWDSRCCFQLGAAAPAFKYSSPFQFMLEVSCWLLGSWNLLEWWRRSNKLGNLLPKKNLVFFSTVITSKPEILLYFGFITSSSSMHSITFPQSHEIKCFGIGYTYSGEE
jgi:hypothetical protein